MPSILCVALAWLLGNGPAEPSGARAVLVGGSEYAVEVEESIREQLERGAQVELVFSRVEGLDTAEIVRQPDEPILARVWLDLRQDDEAVLYLVDASGTRVLIRRLPLESGLDAVGREQVAHVVAAAIEALAGGAVLGITREQAEVELGLATSPPEDGTASPDMPEPHPDPPPHLAEDPEMLPKVVPAPLPPRKVAWGLGLGYQAQLWSARTPVLQHGPLLVADVHATGRLAPGGSVSLQYQPPIPLPEATASVQVVSPRVAALLMPRVGEQLRIKLGVGGGLDGYRVDPAPADGTRWAFVGVFEARAGVHARVHRRVALSASLVVSLDATDARFVVASSGRVLLDPWRVRPGIRIAATFGQP